MYWPISTPRIHATTSSRGPAFKLVESDDGLSSASNSQFVSSPPTDGPASQELAPPGAGGPEDADALHPPPTPMTPHTPAVQSVERHDDSSAHDFPGLEEVRSTEQVPAKDPILAMRMSRAGHLFAVITSTSITLWQTKVHLHQTGLLRGADADFIMNLSPLSFSPSSYAPNPPSTSTAKTSTCF